MTTRKPAPPLPDPQSPVSAALALREAAQAAAYAWARPTEPTGHPRAVSQMHSTLRDLGIAARGLARYHTVGSLHGPASSKFAQDVKASARWLLQAWQHLDGVLAAEGMGRLPDDSDPGTLLCQAARNVIVSWRHPEGTAADRDTTVEHLITSVWFLATGGLSLAACTPRQRTIELRAVANSLAEAAACLTQAVQETADDNTPGQDMGSAQLQGDGPASGSQTTNNRRPVTSPTAQPPGTGTATLRQEPAERQSPKRSRP